MLLYQRLDAATALVERSFAEPLSETGGTHTKIRPHTPTDNAEIERYHRTIGEQIDEEELEDLTQVKAVIAGIIDAYNNVKLRQRLIPWTENQTVWYSEADTVSL